MVPFLFQHQTTNTTRSHPQEVAPKPQQESSLKETMENVPGTPILWTGAAIVALIGANTAVCQLSFLSLPYPFYFLASSVALPL